MQMDKGMDTGDMIDIVRTPIGPDECYGELAERLAILAAEQVSEWIHKIVAGDYPRTPQYHEAATHAAKVSKAEAELSVLRPAGAEYNRFRAFSPSPGPFLSTRELGPLRVHACRLSDRVVEPGYLQVEGKRAWLGFFSGSLELLEVQQAGKKRVLIEQALTGWRLDHAQSFVD
jgi:methionyl-tRNA formyltransferase